MDHQLDSDEKEHAFALVQKLEAMRKTGQDCDLVIKVESEEIPVHRNVMRAQSDYFDAMFTHDTLEKQSGVVEMKTVKFEPVKKCVDFFYTGKISTSEEGCEELLYTSSLIQAKPICEKIESLLHSLLNPKSFFKTRKIAIKYSLENLSKICDEYALKELDSIVKNEEFNKLEEEYVSFLITSKKSSNLHSEDSKLAIVIQWIQYDIVNRQKQLEPMMKLLDLVKVSPGTFKYLYENEALVNQSLEIMMMFVAAGMKQSNVVSRSLQVAFGSVSKPNAIIMFDLSAKALRAYYPASNSWARLDPLLKEMCGNVKYTSAVIDTFLYVLMANKKVYRKSMLKQSSGWITKCSMSQDHGQFLRAVAHGEFIYVTGNNSVERYCQNRNQWEQIDCNGMPFNECDLVSYGNDIYKVGGRGLAKSVTQSVNKMSHESLTWSSVEPMPKETTALASCVLKDKIYVAGGWKDDIERLSYAACYDLIAKSWISLPDMTELRCSFGLCAVEDRIFAVGNFEDPCTIEEFDLENRVWKNVLEKQDVKIMARATVPAYLQEF